MIFECDDPGLPPEHFYSTATVKDSSLDTFATISTEEGYQQKRGLFGIVWDDTFLRGFIDKKTGKTSVQVYQMKKYTDSNWRFFQSVNYEAEDGPKFAEVNVIDRTVDCSDSNLMGGCVYQEDVSFEVPVTLLRKMAARYNSESTEVWKMRFNAKDGSEFNTSLFPAEIVGFLKKLDDYRSKNIVPSAKH